MVVLRSNMASNDKKSVWQTVLKVIIAVASAILGAIGGASLS